MKRLAIERSRWTRGAGKGKGVLCDYTGSMCAVGWLCWKLGGISKGRLTGQKNPLDLFAGPLTDAERDFINSLVGRAADANDDPETSDQDKTRALKELFKELGVGVVFKK